MGVTDTKVIAVTRLGHVGLRCPNVDEVARHFIDVVGLWELPASADGRRHLTVDGIGAAIELIPADAYAFDHIAWELGTDDLAAAAEHLAAAGVTTGSWDHDDPRVAESFEARDPDGNRLQLFRATDEFVAPPERHGVKPVRLGHVAFQTTDIAPLHRFYEDVLNFRWSDSIGNVLAFLRHGTDHHSVNFLATGQVNDVHHIAFELLDMAHMQQSNDVLSAHGHKIEWGPGRHGAGHNVFSYHRDPNRVIIEFYTQMDRVSHPAQPFYDPRPWHTEHPQVPRVWGLDEPWNTWGPEAPASMGGQE